MTSFSAKQQRERLLDVAAANTLQWFAAPDSAVNGKPSDQYWIRLFATASGAGIAPEDAHRFLVTFRLTNRVQWDKSKVAALMGELGRSGRFEPLRDVPELADALRRANKRHTRQTSAASKISTFAKPLCAVYVWDNLARRSAARRVKEGDAKAVQMSQPFVRPNGEHDYAAFYDAAARAFEVELSRDDFQSRLRGILSHVRSIEGPLHRSGPIPDEFLSRRFLDKLMFWEGWVSTNRPLPA